MWLNLLHIHRAQAPGWKVNIYHGMSTLPVCFIPCFAREKGFSRLAALRTLELITLALTRSDHCLPAWEPWCVPVRPPTHSRSEHTTDAQHREARISSYSIDNSHYTTPILPSPPSCRQRLWKGSAPPWTPCTSQAGWDCPGPFLRVFWQPPSRASPRTRGWDRNTQLLARGRQQTQKGSRQRGTRWAGPLVSRLPRTWLPPVPSSPADVQRCSTLPQLSHLTMHYFQYSIFPNTHSNTSGT